MHILEIKTNLLVCTILLYCLVIICCGKYWFHSFFFKSYKFHNYMKYISAHSFWKKCMIHFLFHKYEMFIFFTCICIASIQCQIHLVLLHLIFHLIPNILNASVSMHIFIFFIICNKWSEKMQSHFICRLTYFIKSDNFLKYCELPDLKLFCISSQISVLMDLFYYFEI